MGDEALDTGTGTGAAPVVEAQDAPAGDDSFAFPQDFEQMSDEAIEPSSPQETAPEGGTATPAPQPKPGTPGGQAAAPAKAPAQQAAQQAPAAKPPSAPTEPAQQPQRQAQPASAPQRPGTAQLLERLTANKDSILSELASSRFNVQLTKAETEALETDAVAALPTILSRIASTVYYEAALASLNQIQNLVPHMTQGLMEANVAHVNAEQTFWGQWPNLNRADETHVRTVQQFANFYRQSNPQASQQDAIAAVGKAVSAFLGVPIQAQQGGQRGAPAAPRSAARPFAPAGGAGGTQRPNGAGGAPDPFHGMGMNFDE